MAWKTFVGLAATPLLALAIGVAASLFSAVSTSAADYTHVVDTTADTIDANTADNVCADSAGDCSFRAAIQQSNATIGTDRIEFEIPGDGAHRITPAAPLPAIASDVEVDAYTQNGSSVNSLGPGLGSNAVLLVEIRGTNAGTGADGLTLAGQNITVRGLVINGFDGNGVLLDGGGNNLVEGNFIGTDPAGTTAAPNGNGVELRGSGFNLIGDSGPGDTNLISGNTGVGILLSEGASMNNVRRNLIGVDRNVAPLANGSHGVQMTGGADCNTIGGEPAQLQNVIAHNGGDGVRLETSTGINNYVDPNIMHSNAGMGMDLNGDGVTANDDGDVDTGPNELQNFPEIFSAESLGTSVRIEGILESTPLRFFNIFFFANTECDPSGYGEARRFLGTYGFQMEADGDKSFSQTLFASVSPGQFITTSASNPESTSEFSACVEVTGIEPPTPTPTATPTTTPTATPTASPTLVNECPAATPTPVPTPTPTPFFFDVSITTVCNETGSVASDLHIRLDSLAGSRDPVAESPQGCPHPTYEFAGEFLYTEVDVDWGVACVDPFEAVIVRFGTDCPAPGCPAPQVFCYYWTLNDEPLSSCIPVGSPFPTPETPLPTPEPTPTPTPTPRLLLHGDIQCDGDIDSVDALGVLRFVGGLGQIDHTEPCPHIGDQVDGRTFGDLLCNGEVDAVDALAVLRVVAEMPPLEPGPGCPRVGEPA